MRPLIGEPEGVAFANEPSETIKRQLDEKNQNNDNNTTNRTNRVPLCDQTSFQSSDITNAYQHRNSQFRTRDRTKQPDCAIESKIRQHQGLLRTSRATSSRWTTIVSLLITIVTICWSQTVNTIGFANINHFRHNSFSADATVNQQSHSIDREIPPSSTLLLMSSPSTNLFTSLMNNTLNEDNTSELESVIKNNDQMQQQGQSFSDWWNEFWSRQPFPSGYTQSSITLIACLLTTIIFLIVVGNLLVCIAIFTEKSLKPTQNWFIASLAVSDMLLGLVVMPFSLARELMGFWIFGSLWCDIHEAVDVLLTTASINTLCLISLDRYWSITQAVSYLKKRTPRRGAFMIAFVWVFSAAVSLPPLFGWKKQSPNIVASSPTTTTTTTMPSTETTSKPIDLNQFESSSDGQWSAQDGHTGRNENITGNFFEGDLNRPVEHRRHRRKPTVSRAIHDGPTTGRPIPPPADSLSRNKNSTTFSIPSQQTNKPISEQQHQQKQRHSMQKQRQQQHDRLVSSTTTTFDYQTQATIVPTTNFPALRPLPFASAPPLLLLQEPPIELQQQTEYPSCQLSDDIGYVLYSALGSFYIPCAVMVFTYIKIFLAARSRARRTINKHANAKRLAARRTVASGGGHNLIGSSGKLIGETISMPAHGQQVGSAAAAIAASGARQDPNKHQATITNSEPLMRAGKLVIVERRKSTAAGVLSTSSQQQRHTKSPEADAGSGSSKQDAASATCMLTTSSAKPASPSVLENNDCTATIESNGKKNLTGSASAETIGNESSLITVMSASMADVPITRFNFNRSATTSNKVEQTAKSVASAKSLDSNNKEHESASSTTGTDNRAAALLQAIKDVDTNDLSTVNEILADSDKSETKSGTGAASEKSIDPKQQVEQNIAPDIVCCKQAEREQQNVAGFNSTNETCFMTIEEDSDTFDGQTGRTIMMISGGNCQQTGKHRSTCDRHYKTQSLTARSQPSASNTDASITKTTASDADGELVNDNNVDVVCNNIACMRRHRQQHSRHHQARSTSSYCGSSMTINDEEDVDDEDPDVNVDEDEDESIGDDLLTDDCNGYSGSCALDQYCSVAQGPAEPCPHCDVCSQQRQQHHSGGRRNDNDEDISSPQHLSVSIESPVKRVDEAKSSGQRLNQSHHQARQQTRRQSHCPSDIEGQSLTGDDNLSLTGYRSNDDEDDDVDDNASGSSSASGHDVLDATTDSRGYGQDEPSVTEPHHHHHLHHHNHSYRCCRAEQRQQPSAARTGSVGSIKMKTTSATNSNVPNQRKKSSLGLRLTRLGSSVPPLKWSHQSGGLLALAAESQQQSQQQQQQQQQHPPQTVTLIPASTGSTTGGTRNLKALRQNFFFKLNQLAAKSAARQNKKHNRPSPSDKSSMQRSYEHSVDGATTSNAHSYTEYPPETTIDDYEPQTSGESKTSGTKQRDSCMIVSGAESSRSEANELSDGRRVQTMEKCHSSGPSETQKASSGLRSSSGDGKNAKTIMNSSDKNDDRMLLLRTPQMRDANRHIISPGPTFIASSTTNNNGNISTTNINNKQSLRLDVAVCNRQQTTNKSTPSNHSSTILSTSAIGAAAAAFATSAGSGGGHRGGSGLGGGHHRAYLASDNERHKRKLAKARERRATLILGLIMAAFICSWLPFFTFYVLRALCTVCREYISPRFEAFIFWMGYCNSAINPIIYTIFNRDFRKAFRKILFKCL